MANETSTAVAVTTEQNKVTQELLVDYLRTMNKGLTEQQTKQFLAVAGTFGLNPWKREVYAVTYKNKDGSTDMSIVTGYETYLKRAELNPNYDGYTIEIRGKFKRGTATKYGKNGTPYTVNAIIPDGEVSCVCSVYRKDRKVPVVEEVFFDEYDKGNSMWQDKPRTMLKKVAIVSAFRKAFPMDFGGMPYTREELSDLSDSEKLEQQGFTEVKVETAQEAPQQPAPEPAPAPAPKKTQAERDANYQKACMELRDRNPEVFDTFLKNHALKGVMDIKTSAGRQKFINDVTATINAATAANAEEVEF